METNKLRRTALALRERMIEYCESPERTPDFLKDHFYMTSFEEIYQMMGPDCTFLTQIVSKMMLQDPEFVKRIIEA